MKNRSLIQRIKDGYANREGKAGRPHFAMIAYQLLTFASVIAFIVVSCTPTVTSTMKIVWEDAGPDAALSLDSGPDGGSEPDALRHSMRVSPGLGAVSAGITVSVFNADGGLIGTGLTDDTGSATIDIGDHTGIMIYEIHGCDTGCSYYEESTGTTVPFPANGTLRGVVSNVVDGKWVSGTILTTMAAAFAGVRPGPRLLSDDYTGPTLILEGSEDEKNAAIATGAAQVNAIIGVTTPIDFTAGEIYMTAATADAGADGGSLSSLLAQIDKALNATDSGLSSLAAANLFASGAALSSSATGDAGLVGLEIIKAINEGAVNANIGAINIFVLPDGGLPPLLTDIFPAADAGDDGGLTSVDLTEVHKKF